MNNITNEEIVNEFRNDIEFNGGGDLTSEIDDRKRILGFIKALDVFGMQNSSDLGFKLSILNTLWEELEVKADDVKTKVKEIMIKMERPRKIYSKVINRGIIPKAKTFIELQNIIGEYNSLLRKEAHRQLNMKEK